MTRPSIVMVCCALVLCACSASDDIRRDDAASGQKAGSTCAPEHLTQACGCAGGVHGRQTCMAGAWTACECRATMGGGAGNASAGGAGAGTGMGTNGNGQPVPFTGVDPAGNRSSV